MRGLTMHAVLSRRLSGTCDHGRIGGIFIEGGIPHGAENPQEQRALRLRMREVLSRNCGVVPQGFRPTLR